MRPHTTLVLGGYGFFGARICTMLARSGAARLLIGGRSAEKAARLARHLGLPADCAVAVDANGPGLTGLLRDQQVDTLVHAAGPFQGQDYRVARAALEARCHYIDLADGREFVTGIGVLDAAARARGILVTSGASTVPALSSAVIDTLRSRFASLRSIHIGISFGARVPGLATMRGVFSYCGKPVRRLHDGHWGLAHGWQDLERHRFPAPLGARWICTCDVPDLEILPGAYPQVRSVTFKAGFASDLGHLAVWMIAGLVRLGALRSMVPLARPLNALSRALQPLLSHRGGMFVTLEGTAQRGEPLRVTWNLLAQHNHGPFIPCGAAIVLARKLAAGTQLPSGARPCTGLVTLAEYLRALEGLDVSQLIE